LQPCLFTSESVMVPDLTSQQWTALTMLTILDCRPLYGSDFTISRQVLRRLIAKGCITVEALTPAIYRVTKLGHIARRLRRVGH